MKKVIKEFTLGELKMIGQKIQHVLSLPMKGGISYQIAQWSLPFQSRSQNIIVKENEIILSFCEPGKTSTSPERTADCLKALDEFFKTKDSVEFYQFKLEWIEDLIVTDISILYQFMDDALFAEPEKVQKEKSEKPDKETLFS